jgi:hypothetical protein
MTGIELALNAKIQPTKHWDNFLQYYDRCVTLQKININSENGRDTSEPLHVDDPLMHYITIYDVIERKYAGFSNAIQQLWYGSRNPKRWQAESAFDSLRYDEQDWLTIFLIHRVTGSGASFSYDHGFRNSILADMAMHCSNKEQMIRFVLEQMQSGRPVFTSIGNQIPPFPKPEGPYNRGSELYIGEFVLPLVEELHANLQKWNREKSIREVVHWIHLWHKRHSLKQFHFVMTAFVMDIAEYMPHYIDQYSQVNYGSNAIEALTLLFDNVGAKNKMDFLDSSMEYIVKELHSPMAPDDVEKGMGKAYSLEDVACDYVRYVGCYVPKGYEHLEPWQVTHNSVITDYPKHWTYEKHVERWQNVYHN